MPRARESLAQGLDGPAKELLRSALAALARREYGRAELERKLRRGLKTLEGAKRVGAVLNRLQAKGLLSDERAAQDFVRTRAARYGRQRLEQELRRRGVERSAIVAALPAQSDEFALAFALWQRRFGQTASTERERARQARYLAARGFDPAVIKRILRGADEAQA